MYQIGTNPNAPLGGSWSPEYPAHSAPEPQPYASQGRGDAVAPGFFGSSGSGAVQGSYATNGGGSNWFSSSSATTGGLGGIMTAFTNAIQNVFAQITSSLNGSTDATGTSDATGQTGTGGSACDGSPQQAYTSASATSWGDPHLTFDGTSASGAAQHGSWTNMNGHADLLDSDSFGGGYRVSTTTTAPQANGVTYNANATVTTDGGATRATFSGDGSLAVTERGRSIAVASGQSVDLGNGETVTSNGDGSATIAQTNANGGSITTTLKTNDGHGVDVATSATSVDLGGYLVNGRDPSAAAPGTNGGASSARPVRYAADPETLGGGAWQSGTSRQWSWTSGTQGTASPYQLAGFQEPSIDDEAV